MFGSSLGRFTSPDPYKIVAEVQVEQDKEKAAAMLYRYISRPQQWNQYVYAVNNPLKYTDPSGEKVDLTGDTPELRAAALQRLRNILGEERFKLVTVSADGRSVSLSNENVAAFQKIGNDADNKDFSLGFAEILNSSQTVEFRIADKFTLPDGTKVDLNTLKYAGGLT
jgi:RHS repeat-associated protein